MSLHVGFLLCGQLVAVEDIKWADVLMVLITIPTVVVLLMCIGVGGCGCPSSARTSRKTFASCAFRKSAPSSASAADAATSLSMVHVT